MDLLQLHFQGDCNSRKVQFSGSNSTNLISEMHGESSCLALDVLVGTMVFRPTTQWAQGTLGPYCEMAQAHLPYWNQGVPPRRKNPKESQDVFP